MKPIRQGDKGPAVEDVQRRLRTLGYDLGRAGIDGLYLGATERAVAEFQHAQGLAEDGFVGDETWSALVDATFQLGDRMLYLRVPHFHGHDVRLLQDALNILGFACGESDSIFGTYTERAVREFQRNSGLTADGIVGPETVKALGALRHVWEGKDPRSHSHAVLAPARAADVLSRASFVLCGLDAAGREVAERVANLALATNEQAQVTLTSDPEVSGDGAHLVVRLGKAGSHQVQDETIGLDQPLLAEKLSAMAASQPGHSFRVSVEIGASIASSEREEQRAAVVLLDAICALFERSDSSQ